VTTVGMSAGELMFARVARRGGELQRLAKGSERLCLARDRCRMGPLHDAHRRAPDEARHAREDRDRAVRDRRHEPGAVHRGDGRIGAPPAP
jgi:hypothetical protein